MDNIIATNPLAFTRGDDAIKPVSLTDRLNDPPDAVIQSQLDVSMAQIKNMLGIDADAEPPDAKPVERACYLLAQFYLENRSTQGKSSSVDVDPFKETKTTYYRSQVKEAITQEILNLIAPYRDNEKFMP